MIQRIEIDFALPVELTSEEQHQIVDLIQAVCDRHRPEGLVHWLFGCGSKPLWSRRDAAFLGKEPDPGTPEDGEPEFDDSILHFETCCREAYPGELERIAKRRKAGSDA